MEVRLLPVKFSKAFADYQACVAKLLPHEFDQVKQPKSASRRRHRAGCGGACKLQVMLEYMKADPTVNHIELDGHSDNSGNRLTNRDLSRRRAWRWPSSSRPMASPNADHRALPWRALPTGTQHNNANRAQESGRRSPERGAPPEQVAPQATKPATSATS
jgi:hypothetical protein